MWKYQYDEYYYEASEADMFLKFNNIEDEEAFCRYLKNERH